MNSRLLPLAACIAAAFSPLAQAQDSTLPSVTVTGEKTERPIERTAPSVRVFTERELKENPGLSGANAVIEQSANVTGNGNNNLAPAVRGIDGTGPAQGSDAFLAGTRPRLNIVVDGRTASYNEIVFGDLGLWDVERVEVFRGAQSTLQGRNALAGTVIYKTNDPTFEREFGVRAAATNNGGRELAGVVSGPIVADELAFRLAVQGQRDRSDVSGFTGFAGVDDPGGFKAASARGKLLWKPKNLPGLSTLFTLSHTDHTGPQTEGVFRPFADRVTSYPAMPTFNPRSSSAVVDSTYALGNGLTFENRIVYGDTVIHRDAVPGDGNAAIHSHDWQLEPRLRFQAERWSGFVGLYAFRSKQKDAIDLFGGGAWDDSTQTHAVSGEATYALRGDLDLTVGGRYEHEKRRRVGSLAFFTTDFAAAYKEFLPKAVLAWRPREGTTVGVSVARGYNGGGAAFTYDAPYVNYSFDAESAWTVEAFGRQRLQDGKLLLSGNVFASRYKNMQLPFDLNPDPAIWAYVVRNAPRAQTWGAELGATWLPAAGLRLNAELGLLRTEVTRYPGSGIEGNELARAPRLTAVLGANWRMDSGLELGATARYSSSYFSNIGNVARGKVEPGWLANVRASYPVGQARLFAYVNNLFDTARPLLVEADPNATAAADVGMLPRRRTVGIGVEAWF